MWLGYGFNGATYGSFDGMGIIGKGRQPSGSFHSGPVSYKYRIQLVSQLGFTTGQYNFGNVGTVYTEAVASIPPYISTEFTPVVVFSELTREYNGSIQFTLSSWDKVSVDTYIYCAFLYKKDDRELLKEGLGLNNATLNQLEAMNTTTWTNVLNNQGSVYYLLNMVSGDIMFKAATNPTIRNLIMNSTYANDFRNNENWWSIIDMSQRFL